MPNTKNINEVKDLSEKMSASSAVFLADYAGLTVKEQGELRQAVRTSGGELKVTKNRLLKLVMKEKGIDADALANELTGPNITLFAGIDPVSPLKALVEFAKKNEKELPSIKAGILGKEILSINKVLQLASLPSKTELIAKLLGTLSNPARSFAGVLAAPMRDLVYAMNAIREKKANSN